MNKFSIAAAISLVAGVAAGAFILNSSDSSLPGETPAMPVSDFNSSAATDERIRALEFAVSEERQARQLLEEELLVLFAEIERIESGRDAVDRNQDVGDVMEQEVVARRQQFRGERTMADRRVALIEAGLAPERVDWIMQREQELRFESMQAYYLARTAGGERAAFDPSLNPEAMLRAEIGDADYEMYLAGNNRPTAVGIGSVMPSSPAARAGLQPGDEIVSYNGQRVFGASDLIQQTMQSGEGNVVVDVLRDGAPMQVVLPHGPIGIEIEGFRRR